MTLKDGTQLELDNNNIWGGGLKFDEATSDESSFSIGSAVIGKCTIDLNNIYEDLSAYDFFNATFWLYFGLEGDLGADEEQVYYRKGFYTVDTATYNGSIITLECLDNMWRFDRPFSEVSVSYPTTVGQIVQAICDYCVVTLGNQHFLGYNKEINTIPEGDINCREVLQYLAQICCRWCKINSNGQLILDWYDKNAIIGTGGYDGGTYNTTTTPYSDGDDVDGGTFAFDDGDSVDGGEFDDLYYPAFITQHSSVDVSTDEIIVTGCRVRKNGGEEDSYDVINVDTELEKEHPRYVLVIEDNPYINKDNASAIASEVSSIVRGLPIRPFVATSLNDITYETGDPCAIVDFRGNRYYSFITEISFQANNYESFSCNAESIAQNLITRYSESAKTLVEAKRNAQEVLSAYDNAVKNMNDLAQEAIGYNEYTAVIDGKNVMFRYSGTTVDTTIPEKPKFPDSSNVFKISGDGVFISNGVDEEGYPIYTNGYDANSGTAILNLIYAIGINCDWIKAGTLTLGGDNNVNGLCTVLDKDGNQKVKLDVNGIDAVAGEIAGLSLSNNAIGSYGSNMEGIYLSKSLLSKSHACGGSWTAIDYGTSNRAHWGSDCFVLWSPSGSGGFHVVGDAPQDRNPSGFTAMKHNIFEIWESYNRVAYFDRERYEKWNWAYQQVSDKRLKTDIKEIDHNVSKKIVSSIKPVSYKWADAEETQSLDRTHYNYGFIAQDVKDSLDNAEEKDYSMVSDGENGYLTLQYIQLIPHLVNVVNQQQLEIDLLKKEIELLKGKG